MLFKSNFYFFCVCILVQGATCLKNIDQQPKIQESEHINFYEESSQVNFSPSKSGCKGCLPEATPFENRISRENSYTTYDIIFFCFLISYITLIVYVIVRTGYARDISDEKNHFFSTVASIKSSLVSDDLRAINKFPLLILSGACFSQMFFDFDDIFGDPVKHIEDFHTLISTSLRYFLYIIGICVIYDISVTTYDDDLEFY